jgi:hypothetical protein
VVPKWRSGASLPTVSVGALRIASPDHIKAIIASHLSKERNGEQLISVFCVGSEKLLVLSEGSKTKVMTPQEY